MDKDLSVHANPIQIQQYTLSLIHREGGGGRRAGGGEGGGGGIDI